MSDNNNEDKSKELSEEDFLNKYLEDTSTSTNSKPTSNQPFQTDSDSGDDTEFKQYDSGRASDLDYYSFDCKLFPLGIFYPEKTQILIRAAQVQEIQAYSMVDDTNYFDMVNKMNDMIANCVRIKYPNKDLPSSYIDLKDGDRFYTIFLIRELTFQKGNNLILNKTCSCKTENKIELIRKHFVNHEIKDEIKKYFDKSINKFVYTTINNTNFEVGVPSIGLQKSFTDYIIDMKNKKKEPNLSFLKIIPFIISDKTSITNEGIEKFLNDFTHMDKNDFQFLNKAVDKMVFGIKEVKKKCTTCDVEVHTEFTFPNGASGIFVDEDAFDKYLKK